MGVSGKISVQAGLRLDQRYCIMILALERTTRWFIVKLTSQLHLSQSGDLWKCASKY